MSPVEMYLRELRAIRASGAGVAETSYYGALENLLNAVGRTLRPPVRCIMQLKSHGAGHPDGGLFTPDQFDRQAGDAPRDPGNPSRGVIEIKPFGDDTWLTAGGKQVTRYFGLYRLVLVTNYRDFVLVGAGEQGNPSVLETFRLAGSEHAFLAALDDPVGIDALLGSQLLEYLKRVQVLAAPVMSPQDLAWLLASYARTALARVEQADLKDLAAVRSGLEDALGIRFEGARGEHFFRSSLVQTLFYGIFVGWVLWSREMETAPRPYPYNWRLTVWFLRVPVIQALFHQLAGPHRLVPLKLVEVLDWTGNALDRVDRSAFFARFSDDDAVQYFYEPFVEAFDPELRRQLGVWYTPREVVDYMVERVDTALREELDIAEGLADPRVHVLDPCCGTGAYLTAVIRRIHASMARQNGDALVASDLKQTVMARIYGFELLPAPFVIAHLQVGMLMAQLGLSFSDATGDRAGIYLTNALSGWDPAAVPPTLGFPEFQQERDAARQIKLDAPILVILGNPPYNGYAGVALGEERDLTTAYRKAIATIQPQGQGLNDLYVRFYRMAERRIVEGSGRGIVCFISNYSWLDGLSFTAMREHCLRVFDRIWIDCLNGDKYRTGKLTPDGMPDPSIFSTERNREGIQVGTAIGLLVRKDPHAPVQEITFRQLWGAGKRAELRADAARGGTPHGYLPLQPQSNYGLPFTPLRAGAAYAGWPTLPDLLPAHFPGVKTSRDDLLVDIDHDRLIARMRRYCDPAVSHEELRRTMPAAMRNTARFSAEATREQMQRRGFLPNRVVRYCYRPFDPRWLYWEPETDLLDRKREEYFPQVFKRNIWIEARQKQPMDRFDRGYVTQALADNFGNGLSSFFPLHLRTNGERDLFNGDHPPTKQVPNVSESARAYLEGLNAQIEDLFYHIIAVLHSPIYRAENAGALRQDWPRVPLPRTRETPLASAALGRRLANLLDSDRPVSGVTTGVLRPEVRQIASISRLGDGNLDPAAGDLALEVGWGFAGQGGATMAGKGRIRERPYLPMERAGLDEGIGALGLAPDAVEACLGASTYDVYLNDVAYWKNVPTHVWSYTLGGYQVLKKWLSYREKTTLHRDLRPEEARDFTAIARRIAAILLLEPQLNASYAAVLGTL